MSRKQLLTRWCRLSKESTVHIVTDDLQYQIAKAIENGINNKCEITHLTGSNGYILDNELKKIIMLDK